MISKLPSQADLENRLNHLFDRRHFIGKNKMGDVFCGSCFRATQPGIESHCCSAPVIDKLTALERVKEQIIVVSDFLEEVKKQPKPEKKPAEPVESTGGESSGSDDEPVTVLLPGETLHFSSARKARKALRDRGLSVTQAFKAGNLWKFEGAE